MTHAALPLVFARGGGAIVNVAANAALDPPGGMGAYVASKAALIAFTRSLAREVAERGIRVNAVLPTTIDTPANRAAMPDANFALWTKPEQIAAVIHWLASDAASAVRGALVRCEVATTRKVEFYADARRDLPVRSTACACSRPPRPGPARCAAACSPTSAPTS